MNCLQIGDFLKRDDFHITVTDRLHEIEIEQNLPEIILYLLNPCGVPGLGTFICIISRFLRIIR